MGMPLGDLSGRSLWDFHAILTAWNRAHDPDAASQISDEEERELEVWLDGLQTTGRN